MNKFLIFLVAAAVVACGPKAEKETGSSRESGPAGSSVSASSGPQKQYNDVTNALTGRSSGSQAGGEYPATSYGVSGADSRPLVLTNSPLPGCILRMDSVEPSSHAVLASFVNCGTLFIGAPARYKCDENNCNGSTGELLNVCPPGYAGHGSVVYELTASVHGDAVIVTRYFRNVDVGGPQFTQSFTFRAIY